jgi:hypothetical protein
MVHTIGARVAVRYCKGHEEPPRKWALDPENVQKVVDGMYGVVNEGGTGVRARLPNYAAHVRNAIARFKQVQGVTDSERDAAWKRIQSAAKKHKVELNEQNWRELS